MTSTRDARLVPAAAGASLAVALGLGPLVSGWAWYVGVLVVVAAVAGAGVLTRRFTRNPLAVVGAQFVALVVVLTVLFVGDDAVLGLLPGPQAVRSLLALAAEGGDVAARQAAPVDATAGVLLLVTAGMALVALTIDVVAVTWRRPAVAGLAMLAVYCVPVAVLRDGTSWVWFAVAALAYLALLAAEGQDRIRSWGRVLTGDRSGAGRVDLTSGTGARQAAAASVLLAVLVPALLPVFTTSIVPGAGAGGGHGGGPKITVVNPILDVRKDLTQRSNDPLLTYSTDLPSPPVLRLVADDVFNGTTWQPSSAKIPTDNRVQDGLSAPPGLGGAIARTEQRTDVKIGPLLNGTYLPTPYPATRVDIDGSWIYNSSTLDVLGAQERTAGKAYTVEYLSVRPTQEQLEAAPAPPRELQVEYTALPPNVPKLIGDEARKVAGEGSAYEQAVRLQEYFRNSFRYSTQSPGDGPNDAGLKVMEEFLVKKTGYCVHFASTMAVMARLLGIPARVAVGFLPGSAPADAAGPGQTWQVNRKDAHAWPELYFTGVGWVRFEPTPATQSGTPPNWTIPNTPRPGASPTASASLRPSASRSRPADLAGNGSSGRATGIAALVQAVPWRLVLAVALLAALTVVPHLLGSARRARRWRSVRTRSDRAEAAWDDLRSRCGDLGVTWPASHTPRAAREELVVAYELPAAARDALGGLLTELETARYAPPDHHDGGGGDDDHRGGSGRGRTADELRIDVRTVAAAVAAAVPPRVRRRAWWLPVTAWEGVETLDRVDEVHARMR